MCQFKSPYDGYLKIGYQLKIDLFEKYINHLHNYLVQIQPFYVYQNCKGQFHTSTYIILC